MQTMRVPEDLVAYYRAKGILVGIHADRSIDEVFAEVQDVLGTAAAR
jgi:adenylate kinase family enzyme